MPQTQLAHRAISHILSTERLTNPALEPLWERRDMLVRPTYWIIGACGRVDSSAVSPCHLTRYARVLRRRW